MITIGAAPATLKNLQNHGSCNNVSARKVFCVWRVTLHEALAVLVHQITTLSTTTLGDQRACAVNTGGVELPHFHVLYWNTGPECHTHAIARINVGIGR